MGRAKRVRKFGKSNVLSAKDPRVQKDEGLCSREDDVKTVTATKVSSALYFEANTNIRPPYRILLDTNFFNFSIQYKVDMIKGLTDALVAKAVPYVTDCVIAELEKLGSKYRLALALARDPRVVRLTCSHKGSYADDCLVERVTQHRCYIVGTNDKDLRRRLRKIPGVPIVRAARGRYLLEKMPTSVAVVPIKK